MTDVHSRLVGGSIAERRIQCPASFYEELKAPPQLGSSTYADQGSACHEAVAILLKNTKAKVIGSTFFDHTISVDDFDNLIDPALAALEELENHYGGGFEIVHVEYRAAIPFIPGAFGTCDLILRSKEWLLLVDFKFGAGVHVVATYPDGRVNSQLMFYLSGITHLIEGRKTAVAIIQPTFDPPYTHVEVTTEQLADFQRHLTDAVVNALSSKPYRARGEWCRFAPCKSVCPFWTGPLLDLAAIGAPQTKPVEPSNREWGEFLARAKRLVDSAILYKKEIDDALIEHLRAGGKAPGFGLKPAVKNRKWLEDVDAVATALKKLGLKDEQIWQRKLQTFAVTDAAAKRLQVTIPDTLRPRPPTTDLVLTAEDDPAAVDMGLKQLEFSAALKRLRQD